MPNDTAPALPLPAELRADRLPVVGEVVRSENNRSYALKSILGEGGYGTVFEAQDEASRTFALKAEKWSKTVLKIEIGVLKATNYRSCKHFCQLTDFGRVANEYMFIVLSLLGPDLAKLRNSMIDRHFTLGTAVRVAMQSSSAIEELHKTGFISRDVKPGNFAIGNKQEELHRIIYMFDFGLSRRYVDKNANVLPARRDPGWRGTTRYGSLQAHLKQDLGRKDDYESWLYMIVEITKGSLPWRLVTDRQRVQEAKQNIRTAGRVDFFSGCPQKYNQLMTMIDGLTFEAQPPYEQILKLLLEICQDHGISMGQKYDWETENTSSIHTSVTRSIDKSPSDQQKANNVERPTNLHV
ncbi:Protein kinase domain-containing protein [Aphelenchoides besseyi]|nr:Protein kinase domain-containing protein [Aphelenchoides besseyi]KAI6210139.1 Protein kinase domain-containing protein [Aphelenchoides besseyi]